MLNQTTTSIIPAGTVAPTVTLRSDRRAFSLATFDRQDHGPHRSVEPFDRCRLHRDGAGALCFSVVPGPVRSTADRLLMAGLQDVTEAAVLCGSRPPGPRHLAAKGNREFLEFRRRFVFGDRVEPFFYGSLDLSTGVVRYANAGSAAWLVRGGVSLEHLPPTGPALGRSPNPVYGEGELVLVSPADVLVIFGGPVRDPATEDHLFRAIRDNVLFGGYTLWYRMKEAWTSLASESPQMMAALIIKPVGDGASCLREPEYYEYQSQKCGESGLIRCTYQLITGVSEGQ